MRYLLALFIVLFSCAGATAQSTTTTSPADPTARMTTKPATTQIGEKGDRLFVTSHSITFGGRTLNYTATAGTLAQKDESGKALADMFFVAYTLDSVGGGSSGSGG